MKGNYRELGYSSIKMLTENDRFNGLYVDTEKEYVDCCRKHGFALELRYSKDAPINGGYREKKKTKKRKVVKRKKVIKHKDCSPGNIYESSALLVTSATGTIDLVIALNNPQQIFPATTATGAQDLANNWDAYSVSRVSMSTQITSSLTERTGQWIVVCDHDSPPPTTTQSNALLLTHTCKRKWSAQGEPWMSITPRKLTQAEYVSGIGADPEPAVILEQGKYDWNTPPANGFMYLKLSGGPVSTTIGTVYVRVHVTAWYKRRLALTSNHELLPLPMPIGEEDQEEMDKKKEPFKKVVPPTKKK